MRDILNQNVILVFVKHGTAFTTAIHFKARADLLKAIQSVFPATVALVVVCPMFTTLMSNNASPSINFCRTGCPVFAVEASALSRKFTVRVGALFGKLTRVSYRRRELLIVSTYRPHIHIG